MHTNSNTKTMKRKFFITMAIMTLTMHSYTGNAQNSNNHNSGVESFGNTLNLGIGIAYYGYLSSSVPLFMANYEFNIAHNFTLAPFIGYASYKSNNSYNYGNDYYYYRETIIPIGIKGTYYFDKLLGLNPKWDIYGAASLGFVYDKVSWENGYDGNNNVRTASPLYLDLHIGAEYHVSKRIGIFLDLSTGVSTVGVAIHHK